MQPVKTETTAPLARCIAHAYFDVSEAPEEFLAINSLDPWPWRWDICNIQHHATQVLWAGEVLRGLPSRL
jgi:hypothetical protein